MLVNGNAIEKAMLFFDSQTDLAIFLEVAPSTITNWKYRNTKLPRHLVERLAARTGLPKHEFDPEEFMPWE